MRLNAASLLAAALLTMLAGLLAGSAFAGSDVNGGTNSAAAAAAATGSPAETIDCTPRNYDPRLPVDIAGGRASTTFTIPAECAPIELSYASYKTPWHDYVEAEADQEVLYDSTTVTLGPGTHTLSVALPGGDAGCFYQADFVYGKVIEKFGPVGTDNFYRAQNRMIAADSGGDHSCLDTPPPPPTCPTTNLVMTNGPIAVTGDRAQVSFTIAAGCKDIELSLVSYKAPGPVFDVNTAHLQVLFDQVHQTLQAGSYTWSVAVPNCYYQVDFVYGAPIEHLGPAGTTNFYGSRVIEALNGGTSSCSTTTTTTTTPTTTTTTAETPPTTTTTTTTSETPPGTTTTTPPSPGTTPPGQAGVAGVQTTPPSSTPKSQPKPKSKPAPKPTATTTAEVAGTPTTPSEGAETAAPSLDTAVEQSGSLPFTGLPLGLFGLAGLMLVGAGALFLRAARDGRS